jgi:hypothetical protein
MFSLAVFSVAAARFGLSCAAQESTLAHPSNLYNTQKQQAAICLFTPPNKTKTYHHSTMSSRNTPNHSDAERVHDAGEALPDALPSSIEYFSTTLLRIMHTTHGAAIHLLGKERAPLHAGQRRPAQG